MKKGRICGGGIPRLFYLRILPLNPARAAKAIEKTASHAPTGMGVADGTVVPDGGVVAGCVVGGTVAVGVTVGVAAGVVGGMGVVAGRVVITGGGVGGLVVETVVPPMVKL